MFLKPKYWSRLHHLNNPGGHESAPEGAKRPTAGDEPREFTSRGGGGRVPPFIEKLHASGLTALGSDALRPWSVRTLKQWGPSGPPFFSPRLIKLLPHAD